MKEDNLPAFKQRFEQYVSEHITPEQQIPYIEVEDEISLAQITPHFFSILKHLEPYGPENPRPVFVTRHLINNRYTRRVGDMGQHLKLDLTDRTAAIAGIAFQKGDLALHIQNGREVDACYELEENTFNGRTSIEMRVVDIIPTQL